MTTLRSYRRLLVAAGFALWGGAAVAQNEASGEPAAPPATVPAAPDPTPQTRPPPASIMENVRFVGRISILTGLYDIKSDRRVSNGFDPAVPSEFDSDTGMVGGGVSGSFVVGNYSADAILEYTDIDRFSVTEGIARVGYRLVRTLIASVGYRVAQQGDGFANDDVYEEAGYLVGLGVGPVPVPFIQSQRLFLSGAVTYNGSELDLPSGDTPSADGLTASLRLTVLKSPWSASVRYRRFSFDNTNRSGVVITEEDLTEQYLSAALEYRFQR